MKPTPRSCAQAVQWLLLYLPAFASVNANANCCADFSLVDQVSAARVVMPLDSGTAVKAELDGAALSTAVSCPGPTPAQIASRIAIDSLASTGRDDAGQRSPNGAYTFVLGQPSALQRLPRSATLVFDTQGPTRMKLSLNGVAEPVAATWINEKLVFVRATWTRTLRTDLVVDVERRDIIVADTAVRQSSAGAWFWLDPDCEESPRR